MIKQNRKHISSYNIHVLLNMSEYDVMNMKERIYCVAAIKKFGYFAETTFLSCAWYCAWRSSRHNCLISLHTSSHSPVRNKQQISISSTHWTQWSKYLEQHWVCNMITSFSFSLIYATRDHHMIQSKWRVSSVPVTLGGERGGGGERDMSWPSAIVSPVLGHTDLCPGLSSVACVKSAASVRWTVLLMSAIVSCIYCL